MRSLAWCCVALLAACGRLGFDAGDDADAPPVKPGSFTRVVAYADQTCALAGGRAYCWGRNADAQLGDGSRTDRHVPAEVALPSGKVDVIAPGETHGCAIMEGDLYCFGSGFAVQPAHVPLVLPVTAVAAGRAFTCAVTDFVNCWGSNDRGQLGDGTTNPHNVPQPIASSRMFQALSAGDDHACAVSFTSNDAKCWGHNDNGAIGIGSANADEPTPSVVPGITTLPQIAAFHTCTVDGGKVSCWGRNTDGELGDGGSSDASLPQPVPNLVDVTALAVGGSAADMDATCAVRGGEVLCWGAGKFGRLGNGRTSGSNLPLGVALPGRATGIALGYNHTCALLDDGDIWCWGRGDAGQLGDGRATDSFAPVRVVAP
ncbi:MAG: hypothetical protein KF773_39740 [Deltaproteobacteria bacterium]|nr:hypothetical protein [Deltaproteobacteria bacterium]